MMKITGYSERGLLNSLFYEISHSANSCSLINKLVSCATFPFTTQKPIIVDGEILIEQSFSDFGDADIIILFTDDKNQGCSIFIEAKVRHCQTSDWSIEREYNRFKSGLQNKVNSSNLFAQLYHKLRLVQGLREGGIEKLQSGVKFPKWSTRTNRMIGSNQVVLRATEQIQSHLEKTFFLMLIPDQIDRVEQFFQSTMSQTNLKEIPFWDLKMFGYLTWKQVFDFCKDSELIHTIDVFDVNKGQIF
jgi:hypothetical protein